MHNTHRAWGWTPNAGLDGLQLIDNVAQKVPG